MFDVLTELHFVFDGELSATGNTGAGVDAGELRVGVGPHDGVVGRGVGRDLRKSVG